MQAESSSDDVVLCEERDAVALLTFNRPQVLNAMNAALWTELEQRLARLIDRDQIKVIVFTGAGRAFSSGADLKESQKRTTEEYREYLELSLIHI